MGERVRFMRLVLFFDLPVETPANRRDYRHFVKFLEKEGYLRQQESVFVKLAIDDHVAEASFSRIEQNKPPKGIVQMLKVTEKQYASMKTIVGDNPNNIELSDTSDLVIL